MSIILFLRLFTLGLSVLFYGIILLYGYSVKDKSYYVYYSKVRFVSKLILVIFYLLMVSEFSNGSVTAFHTHVFYLLLSLDIAEVWSRSYKTYGFKLMKKYFGYFSLLLV